MNRNKIAIIFVGAIITVLIIIVVVSSRVSQNSTNNNLDTLLTVSFINASLPTIDTGHYALWGVEDSKEPVLIKRFTTGSETFASLDGTKLTSINIEKQFDFKNYELTIENVADRDDKQSGCILMKGVKAENGDVDFDFSTFDLNEASGEFILATPTDATSGTNEESGVWFTKVLSGKDTQAALKLPVLPECWTWAGYLKYRDSFFRIGRFVKSNEADNFADYSFFQAEPLPVPGEDYMRNIPNAPLKINNKDNAIVIAIEPKADNLRLKLMYEPYWGVLSYTFKGGEETRIPYKLGSIQSPEFQINVSFK